MHTSAVEHPQRQTAELQHGRERVGAHVGMRSDMVRANGHDIERIPLLVDNF